VFRHHHDFHSPNIDAHQARHTERQASVGWIAGLATEPVIGHVRLANGLIFRCELEAQVGQAVGTATDCHFPFKSGYFKSSKACAFDRPVRSRPEDGCNNKSRKRMASSFAPQVPRGVTLKPLSHW
jgi:hypothetical protein